MWVLIPGWRRPPGGAHGNPLQYSCLENPTDRGAWQAAIYRVAKSQTRLNQLSTHAGHFYPTEQGRVSILIRHPQILQISEPLNWSFAYLLN